MKTNCSFRYLNLHQLTNGICVSLIWVSLGHAPYFVNINEGILYNSIGMGWPVL